jgi:hypothetical protein
LRGRAKVIAIKENVNLCPWADMVYGCDAAWWRFRRGLPEFKGLKVTWAGSNLTADYPDLKTVTIPPCKRLVWTDQFQFEKGVVGAGGNSGFQALNIACWLSDAPKILIGFDMHDQSGKHWYGRNNWPMSNNPDRTNFEKWIGSFSRAAPLIAAKGIQVFNTCQNSALKCFPFKTIEQALDEAAAFDMDRVRSA